MGSGSKRKEREPESGTTSALLAPLPAEVTEAPDPGSQPPNTSKRRRLTRKQGKLLRAEAAAGATAAELASRHGFPLDRVESALRENAAGAIEQAPALGGPGSTPGAPAAPPAPTADQLVALVGGIISIGTRVVANLTAARAGIELDNKAVSDLAKLQKEEKDALDALAPYAVQAVPAVAPKLGPACAIGFGIFVATMIGTRVAVLRTVEKQANARSQPLHRNDRHGKDVRRAGGFAPAPDAESNSRLGGLGSTGEGSTGGFPQGAARGRALDARDG